jgi:hypothetical protein
MGLKIGGLVIVFAAAGRRASIRTLDYGFCVTVLPFLYALGLRHSSVLMHALRLRGMRALIA